jgi:hypothetical protein
MPAVCRIIGMRLRVACECRSVVRLDAVWKV